MLSEDIRAAMRPSTLRQYPLAGLSGVHPLTRSSWVNRIDPVRTGDPRVITRAEIMNGPAHTVFAPRQGQVR